ncbi:MAG: GAF domain-containing sensor histidine kinase [Anaerolineales bacterium]|nr:GAF domain-containing sensor histidine kinase [Anaerolineales bacterium]
METSDALILIYFLHGLTFFSLGLIVFLLPKPNTIALVESLPSLALFGTLQSLVAWADMFALMGRPVPALVRIVLFVASAFFFLEFGARTVSSDHAYRRWLRWLPPLLVMAWGLVVASLSLLLPPEMELFESKVLAQYFLYTPGCLLAAWSLFDSSRRLTLSQRARRHMQGAAMLLVAESILVVLSTFTKFAIPPTDGSLFDGDLPIAVARVLVSAGLVFIVASLAQIAPAEQSRPNAVGFQEHNQELDALYRQAEERAQRIAVSNEIIRIVSSARTLDEVFQTFAEQIQKLVPFDRISIALYDPAMNHFVVHSVAERGVFGPQPGTIFPVEGTTLGHVKETQQPFLTTDLRQERNYPVSRAMLEKAGILSYVVLPLIWKDQVIGAMGLGSRVTAAFREDDLHILMPIAGQLAIAIQNARMQDRVQSMAIREERDRLGREMHDGLGQVLGYIDVKSAAIRELLHRGNLDEAHLGLRELNQVAQVAYAEVREAILGLRATVTVGTGIKPALQEFLHRYQRAWGITCELRIPENMPAHFTPSIEIQLLRIIQEALTNVRRHARAQHAWIRFEPDEKGAIVVIEDDGCGFDPIQPRTEQFGLTTMRERAESVGGRLEIESASGQGTRIRVLLPRREV